MSKLHTDKPAPEAAPQPWEVAMDKEQGALLALLDVAAKIKAYHDFLDALPDAVRLRPEAVLPDCLGCAITDLAGDQVAEWEADLAEAAGAYVTAVNKADAALDDDPDAPRCEKHAAEFNAAHPAGPRSAEATAT
jgi:hypothetical protein